MKSRTRMCTTAVYLVAALAIPMGLAAQDHKDHQPTFITFDAPGAGTGAGQGTFPFGINQKGAITGYYYDANFVSHGFLRDRDGTITAFDVPNDVNGTYPSAMNPTGAITGYYCDINFVCPGFVRHHDGTFTTFDAPGDVNGTNPNSINSEGAITGWFPDANITLHGFLRDRDGTITTFDVPGAGTGTFQGTHPASINTKGEISGCYSDGNDVGHGFVRDRDGNITSYDVPGGSNVGGYFCVGYVGYPGPGLSINEDGAITGTYFQAIPKNPFGGNFRGFVRDRDGNFTTFDAANYPPCCLWTFGIAINRDGAAVGYLNDGHNQNHGFLRAPGGTITALDAPGAGTGNFQGTIADSINPAGRITGWYIDAGNVRHGFLWKKDCEQDGHKNDCGEGK